MFDAILDMVMFVSFFPHPRLFFPSVLLWIGSSMALWYRAARQLGSSLGFVHHGPPVIGIAVFWDGPFLWFDLYCVAALGIFALIWWMAAPRRWQLLSVLGSALILFLTYLQVEVSVGINTWYGPFFDMIQRALGHSRTITTTHYYHLLLIFLWLALFYVIISVLNQFFVSHYIFRWRTAMNDYYVSHWARWRTLEGSSQRIQEDTMRFASTTESLGISFVNSVITLIAFTPLLLGLSLHITRLPFFGEIPYALLFVAVIWSILGTGFLAVVGIHLPGLEFKNQMVEAAYRKELVYGEDNGQRAHPATLRTLFSAVRKNYFSLYRHFVYFNVARFLYLQISVIIAYVALGPTIVAGAITFGLLQRVTDSFSQVLSSFQYLVSSWTDIVALQSVYKRLRAFEAQIHDGPLSETIYRADANSVAAEIVAGE